MAEITAALVKTLRESSGAGMMDCKKALLATGGDMVEAADWLRTKGLATAAKKAGRVAAEGLVGTAVAPDRLSGAVIEVNAETDFVARNQAFQGFVRDCASLALATGGDLATLAAAAYPGSDESVEERLTGHIATIGENLRLRRVDSLAVERGVVADYVHNAAAPGLGKIAVVVALQCDVGGDRLGELGRQLAMHVAATRPEAVSAETLDPSLVARERAVLREQANQSGKPEAIVERMVEGRLRKYFQDVVLLEQIFVIDGESRVADVLHRASGELGGEVRIAGFRRYTLGEGLERGTTDFAAEVAATAQGA